MYKYKKDALFSSIYEFLPSAKNVAKNTDKNISKNLSGKYRQKLLIMLNNLQQMHLKLLQKGQFKKQ